MSIERNKYVEVSPFLLFGESMVAGLLVVTLSLPIITIPIAVAIGVSYLRRVVSGEKASIRQEVSDGFRFARSGLLAGVGVLAAAALILINVRLGLHFGGAIGITLVVCAAIAALIVTGLFGWMMLSRDSRSPWMRAAKDGVRAAQTRPGITIMLALVGCACVFFVWQWALLVVPAAGAYCFAATVIHHRAQPLE